MSTGVISFALGLNIKKSNKKNRVNYRIINNKNSPTQFAIKNLVTELKKFDLSDTERNAYVEIAKSIDTLTTMNMKYLAGALFWYYKLHRQNIAGFSPDMFKGDKDTENVLSKIAKNDPPTRADYIQLGTYVTKIILSKEFPEIVEEQKETVIDQEQNKEILEINNEIDLDNEEYM